MHKEYETLKRIEEESRKFVNTTSPEAAEIFRQTVLEKLFLVKLGYTEKIPLEEQKKPKIIVGSKLKIKITLEDRNDAEQLFIECVDGKIIENQTEWGILINPKGIWLFNSKVPLNKNDVFRSNKAVLEIVHGNNTDQKYFEFFSYESIIGERQKTNYFRDIIEYKNCHYKGGEKSWGAYHSTLKRFFKYYSERIPYFKEKDDSVYDRIQLSDFYQYVESETKVTSENALKNSFFYIKDFMNCMSGKSAFKICTKDMLDGFSQSFEKEYKQNIIDLPRLKKAVKYLENGRNSERNVVLLLMLLAFGLERRRLCLLRWDKDIIITENGWMLRLDDREAAIPQKVVDVLKRLKEKGITKTKYIFYRIQKNREEPMREGTVNEVFSRLANINPQDSFYKSLTPANIRSSLIQYLLEKGCPLEEIIYLVNIEIWNLGNYLSREVINNVIDTRSVEEQKRQSCKIIHPMEDFFNLLLT